NYTFRWDNGENDKIAQKLAPGTHTLTVTDDNGCTTTATVEVAENILPLSVQIEQTGQINCFGDAGGSLKVVVSGGKPPFRYAWNMTGVTGENPKGLKAGEYEVTVSDAAGNTASKKIEIGQPAPLSVRIHNPQPASEQDSNDGEATALAEGGVGNYTFRWDNGETDARARALSIGNHRVTVTDGNGCAAEADVEIKKKLIPELRAGRLRVGQTIRLNGLNFEADSTVLNESSKPVLDEIYYFLDQNPGIEIEIGGHTNGIPPPEYCDRLSTERAKNIAEYIIAKGIDPGRITWVGYGKRKPIASNKTPDGRRRNQRVELKILKLDNG
ncbi:MAG: hypothetical protein D6714_03240, partial [Bacteroidetes bacterium]